jgi:2-isopropylmalate synthase
MGKVWALHVEKVLGVTPSKNLRMVSDSVSYLCGKGCKVIFDAEHFFDGYKENPSYAMNVVTAALETGAQEIVLCDTRGGSTPTEVYEITKKVKDEISKPIGIHAHNDRGLATANSLFALMAGAEHVQGTINGLGERCGNANLIEIIGNLAISYNLDTRLNLSKLTEVSSYVYEISNVRRNNYQPFVGRFAFAHKGGIHGDAVLKWPEAYESFDPTIVGNTRSITVSSQTGLANIIEKAKEFGFTLKKSSPEAAKILGKVKEKEAEGYHYENANASLNLLFARALGVDLNYFNLLNWRAFVVGEARRVSSESTVKLKVGSHALIAAAEGNGPVNAFDIALRRALKSQHPEISNIKLFGYRVREINVEKGTAAAVQVFTEFKANGKRWSTIGVSQNILKASEEAIVDGYIYYLYKVRTCEESPEVS